MSNKPPKGEFIKQLGIRELPTEERYEAIVRLWEMVKSNYTSKDAFLKSLGLKRITLDRAINYINDKRKDPKAVSVWNAMEKSFGGKGQTVSESDRVRTRASKLTGYSHDSLSKAKYVLDNGDKEIQY